MRKCGVWELRWIGIFSVLSPALAEAAGPASIDALSLPAPTSPTRFASLETTSTLGPRTLSSGARLSYFRSPLELRTPSPSPQGTTSAALTNVVEAEVLLAGGFGKTVDVGAALPMRFFQDGPGLDAVGQESRVPSPALADPRLFSAYGFSLEDEWKLRPYGSLYLPLGTKNAFGGGASARGQFGLATSYGTNSMLTLDVAVLMSETISLGLTQWGSMTKVGLGYATQLDERTSVSLEGVMGIPLIPQAQPIVGEGPMLLASELLGTVRTQLGDHSLGLIVGVGLPTSLSSSLSGRALTRAPATPLFRVGFEYRFGQSPRRSSQSKVGF